MRIIPTTDPPADDSPQKFWLFSSSFSPFISTPSASDDSDDLPPPPSLPLHPRKKRSRSLSRQKIKKPLEKIKVESQPQTPKEAKPKPKAKPLRRSTERWTAERYAKAEVMVMEVMRDKAKEIGGRIERRKLREEARKYIGDTGLLDHLLKHMCGKVVEEGGLRFMRGFTADGVMQYWLEPADVEETRGKGNEGKCGSEEWREEIGGLSERVEVLDRYNCCFSI